MASDFDATVRCEIADMKFLVLVEAKCHKNPMMEGWLSYETRSAQPSDALTREEASGSRVSGTSTMYSGTYEHLLRRSRSHVRNDPLRRFFTLGTATERPWLIWLPGWLQNHHCHSQLGKTSARSLSELNRFLVVQRHRRRRHGGRCRSGFSAPATWLARIETIDWWARTTVLQTGTTRLPVCGTCLGSSTSVCHRGLRRPGSWSP